MIVVKTAIDTDGIVKNSITEESKAKPKKSVRLYLSGNRLSVAENLPIIEVSLVSPL